MRKILFFAIIGVFLFFLVIVGLVFSFFWVAESYGNEIAVIPIKGEIVSETAGIGKELSSQEIVDSISDAEESPSVKAIFLEINSPGGNIVATRQIVEKVRKAEKPVVSWIGDIGASGAYYIAASSDYIVADPDSITASIGVIAIFPNIEELLKNWGVKIKILKAGENKAIGSIFEEMGPEEERIISEMLEEAFARFKADILELRKGKIDRTVFEEIADGRIMSGAKAKDIGLVDSLGTKDGALEKASELAGIENYTIRDYSGKPISVVDLFSGFGYSLGAGIQKGLLATGFSGISAKN